MDTENKSFIPYFILLGFAGGPVLHTSLFLVLLLVYVAILFGNIFIIVLVVNDHRLHSPMYFFLANMSFLEMCGNTSIVPKLLSILTVENGISVAGCYTQSFMYFFITSSVFLLLAIMAVDRFVAICKPLRYTIIFRHSVCVVLMCACLAVSFICILYILILITKLQFCGHILNHYFCDSAAMFKLICVDVPFVKLCAFIASVFILLVPLFITIISYIFIVFTVMRIPTKIGRKKTFSTCISHLVMVVLIFGSAIFIKIRPGQSYSAKTDKLVNLISTMLAPLVNPFIYTLRNEQVKKSIRDAAKWKSIKVLGFYFGFQTV